MNLVRTVFVLYFSISTIFLMSQNCDALIFCDEGLNWMKLKGEDEFFICIPESIDSEGNQSDLGSKETVSQFYYADVELDNASRKLLLAHGLNLEGFSNGSLVKLRLRAHLLTLMLESNMNVTVDNHYGEYKDEPLMNVDNESQFDNMAVIYSEGFETNTVPGTYFNAPIYGSNCGWKDVNCDSYTGTWSMWCAGNGTECNLCDNNGWFVSGMNSSVAFANYIDISGYNNVVLTFKMKLNVPDIDYSDYLRLQYSSSNSQWYTISEFNSGSPEDEAGWVTKSYTITNGSLIAFRFDFISGSLFQDAGVYIDDINIYGNPIQSGVEEFEVASMISPNPARDIVQVLSQLTPSNLDVYDINGRHVMNAQDSKVLNVSFLNPGVYVLKMQVGDEVITERFIKD
jgi:hypothetical protein